MIDKQIIDENKINPNNWLEPYKPIPACEIKDCDHLVYSGNDVYGCRIAEDGLVCDDFNNDDECCMYRQLEYYKEALKNKEQECDELKKTIDDLLHKPEIQNKILWKIDNEALLGSKDAWIYKLEKTLAEIKEICKSVCGNGLDEEVDKFGDIIDKINEVEDER